ncbi:hypothetical protein FRB97_004638 [Tulasnella sp. 331]|nr:hypothetical protein FRB97_004638 [Tulasnella sp. 331]KAG8889527.1 hypothetical protein FRB98_004001 [Tulasnella sp. 332]
MVGTSFNQSQYEASGSRISQRVMNQRAASSSYQQNDSDDIDDHDEHRASSPVRDTDTILEKKRKNASAQAAFRARRSTYIANLEETVISLETVIRKLQDACRDAHDDVADYREENVRLKALVSSFEDRERIWKAYAKATAGTPAALAAKSRLTGLVGNSQSQPQSAGVITPPSSTQSCQQDSVTSGTCYSEEATVYGDDGYGYGKIEECDGESLRLYPVEQSATSYTQTFSYSPIGDLNSIPPTPGSGPNQSEFGDLASLALVQTNGYIGTYNDYYVDPSMPSAPELIPSYATSSTFISAPVSFADEAQHHRRHTLPAIQNSKGDTTAVSGDLDMTFFADDSNGTLSTSNSTAATSSCQSPELASANRARRHTYAAFPSAPSPSSSPIATRRKSTAGRDSNDVTALSNTLAVIKAQAFGNVRKTRARNKRTSASAGAAKAAVEILEARGLSLGIDIAGGVKRRRRGDGFGDCDKAQEE